MYSHCDLYTREYNFLLTYILPYFISLILALIDRFTLVSSPCGPDAPRPYRWVLCAPKSDISSGEPCTYTNVPDGPRLKILMSSGSKKGTQICYPFLSKVPASEFPPGSQTGLLWREMLHLQSPFQPPLKVPNRWAHSRLPSWAPMKRDVHLQSLPFITYTVPCKGAPPSRFP